ncbi:gliding motility-associated C-terminal domain-containing protein [Myroides sp. WP-1]|uniref:T9SS type B sorting domain-containing protein n=1 Tax=Myroides sp. WP-1 TaxID=2759944 RepID=UPI0015F7CD62|nr:gliding motility-associated C-terminal domain-containing protein [Myroides sp. WP-1]MBB1139364.1 gliding motility-associated C-terminal domain-containing protein [Myroides sp. WP-1]
MKRITMLFVFLFSISWMYGQDVTIGQGTSRERYPFGASYGFERSAALYTAAEINQTGFINSLAWNVSYLEEARPIRIFLKEVESSTLIAANWDTFITGATLVYDGVFNPSSTGFVSQTIFPSFNYTGGAKNLLVLVETNYGGGGGGSSYGVHATTAENMHFFARTDYAPPTVNLDAATTRPNIKLSFGAEATCPPASAVIETIGATRFNFTVPYATAMQSLEYEVRSSGAAGSGATGLAASATVTDLSTMPIAVTGLTEDTAYSLYVRPICATETTSFSSAIAVRTGLAGAIGSGTTTNDYLPIYTFYGSNYSQMIYTTEEVAAAVGDRRLVDKIRLYYADGGSDPETYNSWTVFMGNSTQANFASTTASSWVAHESLGQVFSGEVDLSLPAGRWIEIQLDEPFVWDGVSNLVLAVFEDSPSYSSGAKFRTFATTENRGILKYTDSALSPVIATSGSASNVYKYVPQLQLATIESPECYMPLALNGTNVTESSFTLGWNFLTGSTNNGSEYYLTTDPTPPTEDTVITGAFDQDVITAEITGLDENTYYYVFMRTICTSGDRSEWSKRPLKVKTGLVPVALPYSEEFENNPTFGFENGEKNLWFIGTAVHNGGTKSLYISNDEGVSNKYSIGTAQVSHVYKDIIIPDDATEIEVRFDWIGMGEGSDPANDYDNVGSGAGARTGTDNFRVWMTPVSYFPSIGVNTTTANGVKLGVDYYGNNVFRAGSAVGNVAAVQGQRRRIIIEWKNDNSGGTQPPAAIDNLNITVKTCASPTNFRVGNTAQTTAQVSWNTVPGATSYDIYVSEQPTIPTNTTVVTHTTTASPFTIPNLRSNTGYYFWIRSVCSTSSKSYWVGPIKVLTSQVPGEVPYIDGFEENHSEWTVNRASNSWIVSGVVNNGGTMSMIVSQDGGRTHTYDTGAYSVAHAYRDILVPDDAEELLLTYDWKNMGEIKRGKGVDFFRIVKVPVTTFPSRGSALTLNDENVLVGMPFYGDSDRFKREGAAIDVRANQGQVIRIVLEWKNDYEKGVQPPAAIDNINIDYSSCPAVTDATAELIRRTDDFILSWTPKGTETRWQVITQQQGAGRPDYLATTGVIVEGTPEYIIENVPQGEYFEYYVRPICGEGDDESLGVWYGPIQYSNFLPPMCADIDEGPVEWPKNEKFDYLICQDGPVNQTLVANYFDIKKTDRYTVESIPYDPPFPFFGGDAIDLTQDDEWSDVIDLGFNFCFYGINYDKILISTNGAITFSIEGEVEGGRVEPGSYSAYSVNQPVPYPSTADNAPFMAAIHGIMQDADPSDSPDDYSVNYQILGAAPCRALVFNMYHMGMFSCGFDENDIEGSTTTTQIVLYEGTNIIEVYVKNRKYCSSMNSGKGLIGIQNEDGTVGIAPPERNTGAWNASNEAWRFMPDGDTSVDFKWYKNGEEYSTESEIDVVITESVNYVARAVYETCGDNNLVIEREFNFLKEDFDVASLPNVYTCGSFEDEGKVLIDISENKALVFADLGEGSMDKYTVEYFADPEFKTPVLDIVEVTGELLVYVKVTNLTTKCSKTVSFKAIRVAPVQPTKLGKQEGCESVVLPNLLEGEVYYSQPNGQGTMYKGGDVYDVIGDSVLYVQRTGSQGCKWDAPVDITVYAAAEVDKIQDVVMECEVYVLPALSENNRYFTAPNAQGEELMPGERILEPRKIYVYAVNGTSKVFCDAEHSFTVDYIDCPIPKGISPNGDGINDTFDLSNHGISKIQIFNRNGVEVYSHGLGYKKEWFGQNNSDKLLPVGTYYYVVVSNGKVRTGWVQLNY